MVFSAVFGLNLFGSFGQFGNSVVDVAARSVVELKKFNKIQKTSKIIKKTLKRIQNLLGLQTIKRQISESKVNRRASTPKIAI